MAASSPTEGTLDLRVFDETIELLKQCQVFARKMAAKRLATDSCVAMGNDVRKKTKEKEKRFENVDYSLDEWTKGCFVNGKLREKKEVYEWTCTPSDEEDFPRSKELAGPVFHKGYIPLEMELEVTAKYNDGTVGDGFRSLPDRIRMVDYESELQMPDIMRLITKDLSEPYSVYTYRYFIHNWPKLCLLALDSCENAYVGAIVCKLDLSRQKRRRGYIAMLAVDESCRRLGIGTRLVQKAIANMRKMGCDEVVLETEVTNFDALRLYGNLGFIREKRLFRYYLNGVDAFRLKLFFTPMFISRAEMVQTAMRNVSGQ